jgi:co-chaperonin GroES (HSP10)
MKLITPNEDNVIVKIIQSEEKIGSIVMVKSSIEQSTLAEVLIPARESYYRNGELRQNPRYKAGDLVRIPSGNVGTGVPESPEGEEWVCLAEDIIYYKVEDI